MHPKSIKNRSPRSSQAKRAPSWSKMAPGRYHHQPTWLQEKDFDRLSIDISLIWGWIVQALATKLRIPDRRHRPQGLCNSFWQFEIRQISTNKFAKILSISNQFSAKSVRFRLRYSPKSGWFRSCRINSSAKSGRFRPTYSPKSGRF